MAADTEAPVVVGTDQASERGRYAVYETEDGGWRIATVGPLCDTCSACGCGEPYRDAVPVPPMVVKLMTGQTSLPGPLQAMLGKVMGNGGS